MTGARSALAALTAVGLLLVAGCGGGDEAQPPAEGRDGARPVASSYRLPGCPDLTRQDPVEGGLPDLELPCLGGGGSVRLADLRGTPTVLNVWAAWCTVCDEEMPLLAKAMDRAGDRLQFFGVHYKAPARYGEQSAEDFGVPFPSVQDTDGDETVRALRATAPPQTFFYAADGTLAGRQVGVIRSTAELDRLVERYLGVRL